MMEQVTKLENMLADIMRTKSLTYILEEHFMSKRYKDDRTMDWYSLQRLFIEYGDLSVAIEERLVKIEDDLEQIIKQLYNFERNDKNEK